MRHVDNGGASLTVEPGDKFHYLSTGHRIQVAGDLIADKDRGIIGQSPGDGHTLLLPSG